MVVTFRPATSTGRTAQARCCAAPPETWPSPCAVARSLPDGSRASHFSADNPEETTNEHDQLTRRHDDLVREAGRRTGRNPGRRRAERLLVRRQVGAGQAARLAPHG